MGSTFGLWCFIDLQNWFLFRLFNPVEIKIRDLHALLMKERFWYIVFWRLLQSMMIDTDRFNNLLQASLSFKETVARLSRGKKIVSSPVLSYQWFLFPSKK